MIFVFGFSISFHGEQTHDLLRSKKYGPFIISSSRVFSVFFGASLAPYSNLSDATNTILRMMLGAPRILHPSKTLRN